MKPDNNWICLNPTDNGICGHGLDGGKSEEEINEHHKTCKHKPKVGSPSIRQRSVEE